MTMLNSKKISVLGYLKPENAFHTLAEWHVFAETMLDFQQQGFDTRGGRLPVIAEMVELIEKYFGFVLNVEVERYDLLTQKNVLDFIEDFVNHRFWSFEKEYAHYFPDVDKLRFAYFYSRGDLEPYVLLDEAYTEDLYGSVYNPKKLCHYTTQAGVERLNQAIKSGEVFDISAFTIMERNFFRETSDKLIIFVGNVRAAFRSDIKSMAVDSGRRACNMLRLEYPGKNLTNICYDLSTCDVVNATSLWNEYIATPIEIVGITNRKESL
jgi:hypothetical protein